jgi:hypothetical protein
MFCVLPSLNVPVACNCNVPPLASEGLLGDMVIETKVAAVMVKPKLPVLPPYCALMVVLPAVMALAKPAALTVATELIDEPHVAEDVTFWVLPSESVAVAVSCSDVPLAMLPPLAVMFILCAVALLIVIEADAENVW